MYPAENPIGKPCLHTVVPGDKPIPGHPTPYSIVGVVKDSRYMNPTGEIPPLAYTPFRKWSGIRRSMTLYIRIATNRNAILSGIRSKIWEIDPTVHQFKIYTLAEQMHAALVNERLIAVLSSVFSIVALLLACIGLYGLLAFTVTRRTKEMGIRMALGAERGMVVWLVLRDALILIATGVAAAVPATFALGRVVFSRFSNLAGNGNPLEIWLGSQAAGPLFSVNAFDPLTMLIAVLVLSTTAAIAAYLPARRASRVDPMLALRTA
jgi:ABC-type antimicrobial peptide transport system permease subunit